MFIPILILSIIIVFGGIFYTMTEKPKVPQVPNPEPLPPQEYDEEALKQSQLEALAKLTPPTPVENSTPSIEVSPQSESVVVDQVNLVNDIVEMKPKKKKRYYKPKSKK